MSKVEILNEVVEAEILDKAAEKAYAKDFSFIGMSANITYKLGFRAGYEQAKKEYEALSEPVMDARENHERS